MAEKESKIVNVSTTTNAAALAFRAASISNTIRNKLTDDEAARQNVDLEPVRRAVQEKSGIATAQRIKAKMKDTEDVGEFIDAMFESGKTFAYDIYETDVVEKNHDKVILEGHYCPLVKAWQSLGLDDDQIAALCDRAMIPDQVTAKEMGYNLEIQKTIAHGDGCCRMVYTNKKKD